MIVILTSSHTQADIEEILNKRARKVKHDPAQGPQESSRVGNIFSKMNFKLSENESVAVDDPDFWEKVMPNMRNADALLQRLEGNDIVGDGKMRAAAREVFMQQVMEAPPRSVICGEVICS